MPFTQAGQLIKEIRVQKGISQQSLANGIMERSNLSRLEKGKYKISKVILDDLLNRLGYMDSRFFNFALSNDEFKIYSLRERLKESLSQYNEDQASKLIEEMEQIEAFRQGSHKQFLLGNKAKFILINNGDTCTARVLLDEAIKMTLPEFNETKLETYLLTREDIEIIDAMANVYFLNDDINKGIMLLDALIRNVKRNYIDEKEKAHTLSLVMYNLSKYLGLSGLYQRALDICDEAIQLGTEYNVYGMLPLLIFNKACCLFYLKKPERIKGLVYQSYFGCVMMNRMSIASTIKENSKELLGIEIDP